MKILSSLDTSSKDQLANIYRTVFVLNIIVATYLYDDVYDLVHSYAFPSVFPFIDSVFALLITIFGLMIPSFIVALYISAKIENAAVELEQKKKNCNLNLARKDVEK
jgi:hypothetical protein